MKIALLGAGKTGGEVEKLHSNTLIFNSSNIPSLEKLKECDVIISFLPGEAFLEYIDLLVESCLPVITGSTGFEWPKELEKNLINNKLCWVYANNFSLGMSLVKNLIESIGEASHLFEQAEFSIHDIHHTKKIDSPSGTALSWQDWLGKKTKITSERTGDVIGYHHIELKTEVEEIKLIHEAKDRCLFAKGALWSAQKTLNEELPYGLMHFNDLVNKSLQKDMK